MWTDTEKCVESMEREPEERLARLMKDAVPGLELTGKYEQAVLQELEYAAAGHWKTAMQKSPQSSWRQPMNALRSLQRKRINALKRKGAVQAYGSYKRGGCVHADNLTWIVMAEKRQYSNTDAVRPVR